MILIWFKKTIPKVISLCLVAFTVLSVVYFNNLTQNKISKAAFQCPNGYNYAAGNTSNPLSPLPHNCTKIDEQVLVCENDYIPNPASSPLCIRDLVIYPCPKPLTDKDYIIHKSISNPVASLNIFNFSNLMVTLYKPISANAQILGLTPEQIAQNQNNGLVSEYSKYGDLCTKTEFKDQLSMGNVCSKTGLYTTISETNNTGIFNIQTNTDSGSLPLPDKNGLVSYFNDLAFEGDYRDLKTKLFDMFNNDNSYYQNQLCYIPTKALRANVSRSSYNPGCFLGIGCTDTTYKVEEAVSEVADSCDIAAKTCRSLLVCTRTIHKCEPQDKTYPITDFNSYVGKENTDKNGKVLSNGRSVEFLPDYENLPQDRTYLPNEGTSTICPNSSDWRPFYVGAKTDFRQYDTGFLGSRKVNAPFTCIKKGFDTRAAYVIVKDNSSNCGGRTQIYGDTASNDDSAFIICTPPLTSDIRVLACPGGTSINTIGDYSSISGTKCYKSIPPLNYIVDNNVIQAGNCKPDTLKVNTTLKCQFDLYKENFAGYNTDKININNFDFNKPFTKYLGSYSMPVEGIISQIQNQDSSVIASSTACYIPTIEVTDYLTNTKKNEPQNLIECGDIKIGDNISEGEKNIVIKIGNAKFLKGKIDSSVGCDVSVDIYKCYSCVAGQAYSPASYCFQPGNSVATTDNPFTGTPGQPVGNIPLENTTIPDGTKATLDINGTTITGTIVNGGFVPDTKVPPQTIPDNVKTGPSTIELTIDNPKNPDGTEDKTTPKKTITIPVNFSNPPTAGGKDASGNPNISGTKPGPNGFLINDNGDLVLDKNGNPIRSDSTTDQNGNTIKSTNGTTGPSINTIENPISVKIGDPAPEIDLPYNTLPNGTIATFTPPGTSTAITGIIKDNKFIPYPNQIIPVGTTVGIGIGILRTSNSTIGVVFKTESNPELIKNVPFTRTGGMSKEINLQEWILAN